jgi:hypothetical protein
MGSRPAPYKREKKKAIPIGMTFSFLAYPTLFSPMSCSGRKMQRKIAERCIRYSTKVGLSPASTTTLPLLDTKIGCGGRP